jgi:hypothetical protein
MRQQSRFGALFSKKGRLTLVFIDRGVNINGEYYKTEVLEKHLLPTARTLYGEGYFFSSNKTELHQTRRKSARFYSQS